MEAKKEHEQIKKLTCEHDVYLMCTNCVSQFPRQSEIINFCVMIVMKTIVRDLYNLCA